ncbi:MAG TPA: class I SAM-dependent methyltransferase [Pirellulales bacterium]|nr:class I SAM-dependent methyltransferase [Pirellulales bacterium]
MSTALSTTRRVGQFTRHLAPVEWEETACSLCGSHDYAPVLAWRDDQLGVELKVVRCRTCDLTFTNPRPTPGTIGYFYPNDYSCYELRDAVSQRWKAQLRRRLQRSVLRSDFAYPPQPAGSLDWLVGRVGRVWLRGGLRRSEWIPYRGEGRLLDFGCGTGAFLQRMRDLGWQVEGLDMSTVAAHTVMRHRGIKVHVGTLPHADLAAESFDCVTMWQALEHVHDPRLTVREARRLLRPRGLLVVAVPNVASWSFRHFGRHWFGLDVPRHLTHFSPDTLNAVLAAEGFRLLKLTHVGVDGWLRQSARRLAAAEGKQGWRTACQWKPLAQAIAGWTERARQADDIVAIAERG